MTTPIVQLKSLGIDDLMKFEWVTAPPAESILRALEGLVAAGMIGEDGRLTVVGEQAAECPVEVAVAGMVSITMTKSQMVSDTVGPAFQLQGVQVWWGNFDYCSHDICPGMLTNQSDQVML
jgi:HrpA-like RNA helicase